MSAGVFSPSPAAMSKSSFCSLFTAQRATFIKGCVLELQISRLSSVSFGLIRNT